VILPVERKLEMPDYEGYVKSLERILEGVSKDYWSSFIDINRHAHNVGRVYLWVSGALFGVYLTALDKFFAEIIASSIVFFVLVPLSFLLVILAFGISLYAMPAKKGYKPIPQKGWGEFSHEAYRLLKKGSPQVYASFLTHFISRIDHAFAYNVKTNKKRASLLRKASGCLLASFLFAIASLMIWSFQNLITILGR